MKAISLVQVCEALGLAQPAGPAQREMMVAAVCTDTRHMQERSLFVALRGERFDGHDFLHQAAAGGAVAALIERKPPRLPQDLYLLPVADTRLAMGRLARFVRQQLSGTVIAVGGSNGKTTTKHLIDAVLRGAWRGSISPKSYNNDIGVPLTIFPAEASADYLVLEMGTNHPGEIAALARIALPEVAVITNCSAEHLEGLGDLAGVRRENACLIEGLPAGGLLVVNGDDPELLAAVGGYRGQRVTFGFSPQNDLCAREVKCDARGTSFALRPMERRAFVPLLGRHTACNALAAIAVGRYMGLSDRHILENLRLASGPEMRLALQQCGSVRVLNDAYNANPASMKVALQTLAALPARRRVAVVGEMRELGKESRSLHREMGRFIARDCAPDLLVCVGLLGQEIGQEAARHGLADQRVQYFPDAAAACAVAARLHAGDLVLLKASRAVRLETVARAIHANCGWPGDGPR